MSGTRRNLLFMMTDHGRADSVGATQAGIEIMPAINRLARAGTRFSRAYTTCPLCVPARTALATGVYPTRNGVVYNDWGGRTAADLPTIHETLAGAGYRVGHVGVDHIRVRPSLESRVTFEPWLTPEDHNRHLEEVGLATNDSLDRFRAEVTENQNGRPTRVRYSSVAVDRWVGPVEHFKDSFFAARAVDFLRQNDDRPFALFLYLWAPHPPLRVPEPYYSMYDPNGVELPPNVGMAAEGEPESYRLGIAAQLAEGVTTEDWRRVWAAHLGLSSLADACMGRVLRALDQSGRRDNTIVLYTSDHGEQLGQHRMYQKMEMYEPALRVPMIISGPGVGVGRVDTCVSHLDIVPTLHDLLELGVAGADGRDVAPADVAPADVAPADVAPADVAGADREGRGRSLAAALSGAGLADRAVFAQYSGNPTYGDVRRTIVTPQYKYTYDQHGAGELYDLEADPLEMKNLAHEPAMAEARAGLEARCRRFHGED